MSTRGATPNTHWDTPSAYQRADLEPLTNIRTSCSNLVFRWSLVGSLKSDECRGMKENGFDAISSWMIWPSTNWHWAKLKSRLLVGMVGEGGALTADLHLREFTDQQNWASSLLNQHLPPSLVPTLSKIKAIKSVITPLYQTIDKLIKRPL